ncbi:MAG: indole-3-glycerol phosphate synthase TrpC [Bacteroidia bacterium]|nr:indole-3-glycerol phosphate synthase TrpC [Bacteroidia bacterium]
MQDILQEIIAQKRIEVEKQKHLVPPEKLAQQLDQPTLRATKSMRAALASSSTGIIAEFKRKSPSKGWIFPEAEVTEVVPAYEAAGASACSILTDEHFFGGSLEDLRQARQLVSLPLLRKEFIIDPYQLTEARIAGADAILLIATVLTPEECFALAKAAHALNLEVLLEIHNENELGHLNDCVDMLGINNRNLGTFETSLSHSYRLAEKLRQVDSNVLLVSESGISEPSTVVALRAEGFRGFLIGETFMRGGTPGATLTKFINGISHAN